MTDRDRLIELIVYADTDDSYECKLCTKDDVSCRECGASKLADHLLANGVIVPPCKVGDSIFRVGNGEIWEWLIEHIEIYGDEIGVVDDGENYFTPDKIGKTVFLAKEEAEAKLKEMNEDG